MNTQTSKLKHYRRLARLTQPELGRLMVPVLKQSTVSAHEVGARIPDVYTAIQYARALGCAVEDLFVLGGDQSPPSVEYKQPSMN